LGQSHKDQKKLHLVIDALRKFYRASIGVSGESQKFLRLLQEENEDVPQEKPPLLSGSDAQALQFLKMFADEVHMADIRELKLRHF